MEEEEKEVKVRPKSNQVKRQVAEEVQNGAVIDGRAGSGKAREQIRPPKIWIWGFDTTIMIRIIILLKRESLLLLLFFFLVLFFTSSLCCVPKASTKLSLNPSSWRTVQYSRHL